MKLFIFGSTGDLCRRKVLPALAELGKELEIFALGRRDFSDKDYHEFIGSNCFKRFKTKPRYIKINFEDEMICEKCIQLLDRTEDNFFYIAMPPNFIKRALTYVGGIKEKGFKIKILIEKPFGENLEDAKNLKKIIIKENLKEDVFISDHYLFKKEVIELKKIDFKHIKIVSLEEIGLENRSYYDEIGALKDMIQSHFLNIVFKLLKNPRGEFYDFDILEYKKAQYGNGKDKGYVNDLGKKSSTETFAKVRLKTQEKEFEFITGKRFDKRLVFIEIDKKRIYAESSKNPYVNLFLDFFSEIKENFASIDNSILAWEIIEKIESKKQKLDYYPENSSAEEAVL